MNSKRAFLIAKRAASVATRATVYLAGIAASFIFELCMAPILVITNLIHFIKFNIIDKNLFEQNDNNKLVRTHFSKPQTLNILKLPFENLYTNSMFLGNDLYNRVSAPLQTNLEFVTQIEERAHAEQQPSYCNMLKNITAIVLSKMPAMPVMPTLRSDRSNSSSPEKPKLG